MCPVIIKNKTNKKKISSWLDVCTWCSLLYWLVFTRPCPLSMELKANQKGRRMTVANRQLWLQQRDWREGFWTGDFLFSYLDVHWKYILHAFHWATHLDYQHYSVCVCARQSMPTDQRVEDGRRLRLLLHCCWVTGTYECVYVESESKFCCKEDNLWQNVIWATRWIKWKCSCG